MALAVVGGAFLSSFLNVLFDRMASPAFIRFFKAGKMNISQFRKLKTLLNTVSVVLDDAEHKQIASPAVKNWLDELRDAADEAVDLLDLIDYQAAAKVEADQQATANQMLEIIDRLEYLKQQIGELGLRDGGRKDASSEREPATSLVEESDIFGRNDDKKAIFELLEENETAVIPIVGMGGIGKTTLAQLVYNDGRAIELFERRVWVCVSENYDGFKIKREILKQVDDSRGYDGLTPTQIDEQLKKSLKDKKYLIVLDDMWNDSYADWDKLITPLKLGAPGSKIIVTTRGENVASVMRTIPSSYQLLELDPNDCWLLFAKHAFKAAIEVDRRLIAIGKEIVGNCKGLPLAAKMLGGLLRCKRDVLEWNEILNNNIWDLPGDNILPTLRLSYQHLPSHLKQCFAYCAVFPKDYEMDKQEIIYLWMAEGFLTQPVRGKKMEELGEECFDELVSRSFLQESRHKWDGQSFFVMHDLINDLARQIYGDFLARIEENGCCKIHEKTRHISYMATKMDGSKIHESISQVHVIRTFLTLPLPFALNVKYRFYKKPGEIVDDLLHNQIPRFWSLRVLSLCGFHNLMRLPDSIDNLKLLRYLNVARTNLKRLPESLCSLYNLQTLILYGCDNLVELPKNIGALINMHCLDIKDTPRLGEMPPGIGNLKDLRILCKFIVGYQNGLDINELVRFEHLRGALSILELQNVVQLSKDVLQNKKYLKDLELKWSSITEDSVLARSILERLQPHTSIQRISIFGYGGTKFANWLGDSSYINMESLKLHGCKYCTSLPPLGQLSFLKYLSISKFDAVVEVGAEFYGVTKTPFRTLETLEIEEMSQWQGWIICEQNNSDKCESFPKLGRLFMWNCPKLESITTCKPTHKIFRSLNEWRVINCPNLRTSDLVAISNFKELEITNNRREVNLAKLPSAMYELFNFGLMRHHVDSYSEEECRERNKKCNHRVEGNEEMQILCNALCLEKINIRDNTLLQSIPLEMLQKLQELDLVECDNLKYLSSSEEPLHQPLKSLDFVMIEECHSLICFPKGGIPAPSLKSLNVGGCLNLKSLPERMHVLLPSLQILRISNCGEIKSFPEGGLPARLQSLTITSCNKLISGRLQWGLQRLDALSYLCLGSYDGDDLQCFPEQTLLPSSLDSLTIVGFYRLQLINSQGLQHLTSLHSLSIDYCYNLHCLPEGLPSSLSCLNIWQCKLLKERCESETGQDWSKISHISTIKIDGRGYCKYS